MKLDLNIGDALLIQTHKETIKVQCTQTGYIEVVHLD
jgi:hypothetical protein